jgi:hypothetical protein
MGSTVNPAPAVSSGGAPGGGGMTEKERQAEERSRAATQGICRGC